MYFLSSLKTTYLINYRKQKNLGEEKTDQLREFLGLDKGDAAFFLGGIPAHFNDIAGKSRDIIGLELGIINSNSYD